MLYEATQIAQDTATQGKQVATIIGLAVLIVSNIGIWLDKFVQMSKDRTARKEAEARAAEAKSAAGKSSPATNPGNDHFKYIVPHSMMLERHEGEIKALVGTTAKFERENREDHHKIFGKLDDLKDLIIGGQRSGARG